MADDRSEVAGAESETGTGERLDRARRELDLAADHAGGHVMEQLHSVREGLDEIVGGDELVEGDKTRDSRPHADRLDELREKLAGLESETDEGGTVDEHVEAAATHIAEYRQDVTGE
ncbi:hypothetical protein HUG10_18820 (plasmid) [Halorarum halophilum]|uniref:Uncharacterized protein n=1 Tax=Halorarum halophilum TaxID=2743090 RepID=A0A7D5KPM5_9EURY|nr:hypothetical protein [Halobaculum halophilum]QLG29662.1 hypothetical protein HUG10_18820 [Halobaculum halophilum]